MIRSVCFTLIFILGFAILGCKNKSVDPGVKPEAIRLIPHGTDNDFIERGIDADSETDGIFMEWFLPVEDDIDYVEIYRRAEDETIFLPITKIFFPDTSYIDENVAFQKRYFYFVFSVNEDGLSSVSSDTLFYTLLEKPVELSTSDSQTPKFSWRDPNPSPAFSGILKLMEAATETPVWIVTVENPGGDARMSVDYNSDGSASLPALTRGTDYLWRVDVIGSQTNSGSESPWTSFNIP